MEQDVKKAQNRTETGGIRVSPGGHSRKKLDLTGQRYGRLTVLAPAQNIGNRTAWLCRCACGRETVVATYHLRSGHTSSCGCIPHPQLTYVDGTCVEMLQAKTVRSNNTSGVPGVDWRASKNRWRASICFKGKRRYLGSYLRFEDAVQARMAAEEALHNTFLREHARKSADSPSGCLPSRAGTADINAPAENR